MNMSFSITLDSFSDGSKDVTRRLGWLKLKPGDIVNAVEKVRGLKKGQRIKKLGVIKIVSATRERLDCIEYSPFRDDDSHTGGIRKETVREGFPAYSPAEFVSMFCKFNGCKPTDLVTRIVFLRVQ